MISRFFVDNRRLLMDELDGDLVILAGFTGMQWHGDTAVPFRQEAGFRYLTGIEQPDWRLIIDGKQGKSWLVAPEVSVLHQVFDGSLRPSVAKSISGVDEVLDEAEGDKLLHSLAKRHSVVHTFYAPSYASQVGFVLNPAPEVLRRELMRTFDSVEDCRPGLDRLRAIKQSAEVDAMKRASIFTSDALNLVKSKMPSYKYEYEIEAELTNYFRRHGAAHAFEPIVASGGSACTLHYTSNSSELQSDQLILMDIGAQVDGYCADISRTFAFGDVGGRHGALHRAVQSAQEQIVQLIRPGLKLVDYTDLADSIMIEALLSLGLMKDASDEEGFRRYFPHAIGHGLGSDVHESLGGYKELRPGMVLTVEPGIYVPEEGTGVRIEDSILVTETGRENLTVSLSTDM